MWNFRQHVGFFLFLIAAHTDGETVFKQEPKDDAGVPGDDVDMDCVIEDYYVNTPVSYTVIWYRNNVQFLPELDENFDYINNDPTDTGDWSLRIFDIDVSQRDGTYYCRYNSGLATSDSSTAKVVVAVPATLSMTFNGDDVTEDNEVTVKAEDSSVEFICEAKDGNPEPVISWFVGSKNITDSSVQVDDASTLNHAFEPGDNEAILQCRVFTHELLEIKSLNKTLDVQYFIEDFDIEILHDGGDTIVIGDQLELECAADGNPEPVYTWSKDDNALQETSRILKKDSVTLDDEGSYKCEARNDFGEGSAELQITVNGEPFTPVTPVTDVEGNVDEDIEISLPFCSVPPYAAARWEWNNDIVIDLTPPTMDGSYENHFVATIEPDGDSDTCFKTMLHILEALESDSGTYSFVANNGKDVKFDVNVYITKKTNVAMIVGLTFGILVLVIIIIATFAFVKKIWCFKAKTPEETGQSPGSNNYSDAYSSTRIAGSSARTEKGRSYYDNATIIYTEPNNEPAVHVYESFEQ